jgi:hypothetical protein
MLRLSDITYESHEGESIESNLDEEGNNTPKSQISAARLRLLELTPVQNCLVVDKSTFEKHYKNLRRTEIIKSKKLSEMVQSRVAGTPISGLDSSRFVSMMNISLTVKDNAEPR